MLFNSIEFLLFLPILFLLYWFIFNRNLKLQNLLIVVASYIFYGWWDMTFLLLIAFTTLCSFVSGILIDDLGVTLPCKNRAKWLNITNIAINLSVLGVYKYFNFFADSLQQAFASVGVELSPVTLNLVLPVGISFYTFQALSYSIDVYRGKISATRDIVSFFAFVSFFPQLVAGPIERATNLLPQFEKPRHFNYDLAVDGCRQMLWGFFKKIMIADICAVGVNAIFADYTNVGSLFLITGALLFTFQIYCDFSAYSDIAIGCAKLFGIRLMRNFNVPYFSRDIAEFWRRWHISLTTWFRDYLYIPLGGSRGTRTQVIRNTFIIFLVSGFWHGANWTYIAWGAYHAVLFVPLLLMNNNRKNRGVIAEDRALPTFKEFAQIIITFLLAAIGWVIFRAESITEAVDYLSRIVTQPPLIEGTRLRDYIDLRSMRFIAYSLPIMIIVEWISRRRSHAFDFNMNTILRYKSPRWAIYLGLTIYILYAVSAVLDDAAKEFIYFQF